MTLPTRSVSRVARAKFEHTMLLFRRNGLLGFHCCQLQEVLLQFSTLDTPLTDNVGMAPVRKSTPLRWYGTCHSQF
jgi:hypothetical protein